MAIFSDGNIKWWVNYDRMISDKYVERVNFHYLENDELAITLC